MSFLRRQLMGLGTWVRILILILIVLTWGLLEFLFASKHNSPTSSECNYTMKRLNEAIAYLKQSKRRNSDLKMLFEEFLW